MNHKFFNQPNINNSYWAGLIAADGYIYKDRDRLEITLKESDVDILYKFKKDIEYDGPIHITNKIWNKCRISFSNEKIIEDLKNNFNIYNNKSLTLEPPKNLNSINSLCFTKGYIDGDGCISYDYDNRLYINIVGTYSILEWIRNLFLSINKDKVGKCTISKMGKIYRCSIFCSNAIYFYKLLKSLDTPELARKWNKVMKEDEK